MLGVSYLLEEKMNNSFVQEYIKLHNDNKSFGSTGEHYLKEVCLFIDFLKPKVVLNYGCGKCSLINKLKEIYPSIQFYGYDPAIENKNILPVNKADFVINTDVLEHIPVSDVENTIKEISLISKNCYFYLNHAPAMHILPNGENAHCTIKPASWYYNIMDKYFDMVIPLKGRSEFTSVVITFGLLPNYINQYYSILEAKPKINYMKKFFQSLFSVKNEGNKKIIRIIGFKIKIPKRKYK